MALAERSVHDAELAGLDALAETAEAPAGRGRLLWRKTWPKAMAAALAILVWQVVVWSGWRPSYVLPGPGTVLSSLASVLGQDQFWSAVATTLRRALVGYALAVLIGIVVGSAVARVRPLRSAVGSLITGLQTMPSIVWFPLAIVLFQLSESAILFVVVLGAAPSVANGLVTGVDHVPPLLIRSGRVLGARGWRLYRHVILPAALPSFVGGLKQGWAFAWRSLMAGELLVLLPGHPSLGSRLEAARQLSDYPGLVALMLVILAIGILADTTFGRADLAIRRRWGLIDVGAA
jgi:NitT/TauT family transport system permease protein